METLKVPDDNENVIILLRVALNGRMMNMAGGDYRIML